MSELLKKIHLFDNLTERELEKNKSICVSETHAKDAILLHEGDLGNRCYLITKGAVRISKFIPNIGEEALVVLKAGDYFGEMALIDNFPRSAHAIANTDIEVLAIDKTDLDYILNMDHELGYKLLRKYTETLFRSVCGRPMKKWRVSWP